MTTIADPPDGIPVIRYAARSKAEEIGKDSVAGQLEAIDRRIAELGGRYATGEPHTDHASGFTKDRGPGLAAAIREAEEAAAEHGTSELWVFASNRLGRGTGLPGEGRALGLLFYMLRAVGVAVRSVEDDHFTSSEAMWGIASSQASKYSQDLSAHVTKGKLARARAGLWSGGPLLDGYKAVYTVDDHGNKTSTLIKHPGRRHIIELAWEMALDGRPLQIIEKEFAQRGYVTGALRRDHQPRPFDVGRLSQILENDFYAGVCRYKGEVLPGVVGQWPQYVTPEQFAAAQADRRKRSQSTKRGPGRPSEGYILAQLATCGVCGLTAQVNTSRVTRPDGSRTRRYVCRGHRDHHAESVERCPVMPFDAVTVDRMVLEGLDHILGDASALADQLLAGRRCETERLSAVAGDAHKTIATATSNAKKIAARYQRALADGDETIAEVLLDQLAHADATRKQAQTLLDAALDALTAAANEPEESWEGMIAAIWEGLAGRLTDAAGSVKVLNLSLREVFDRFELSRDADGALRIQPVLGGALIARILRDPTRWPHGMTATVAGHAATVIPPEAFEAASGEPSIPGAAHLVLRVPRAVAEAIENGEVTGTLDVNHPPPLVQKLATASAKTIVCPS